MNRIITIVLFTMALCGCHRQVVVEGCVPLDMDLNGQWAYLYVQYDWQMDIIDSCVVRDNTFRFEGKLPYEEMLCGIAINQEPSDIHFTLKRGESVSVIFNPTDYMNRMFPEVLGSTRFSELRDVRIRIRALRLEKIEPLKEKLNMPDISESETKIIRDSIEFLQNEINSLYYDLVYSTQSCYNVVFACSALKPYLSKDGLDSMISYIDSRFPGNPYRSNITNETVAPPTHNSIWAHNRIAQVVGNPLPFPNWKYEEDEPDTDNKIDADIYGIGDLVENIELPGLSGTMWSLYDTASTFTLIDFWASWCAPCLAEMPYLKKALEESSGKLAICSISIDQNLHQWKNAVAQNEMQAFNHAILRKDHPQFDELMQLFDIRTIPANFLLDKDRRIIATNLRGEELQETLKRFISKK